MRQTIGMLKNSAELLMKIPEGGANPRRNGTFIQPQRTPYGFR